MDVRHEPDEFVPSGDNAEKRLRTLTEKGAQEYAQRLGDYHSRLDKTWDAVEDVLVTSSESETDLVSLKKREKELLFYKSKYIEAAESFEQFLIRTNSTESKTELSTHTTRYEKHISAINRVAEQLKLLKEDALETVSVGSSGRHSSGRNSSTSETLVKKRVNAEVQRKKLEYVEKQTELLKEKAELEAKLSLLEQEKESAVAEMEARMLEESASNKGNPSLAPSILNESVNKSEHVEQFLVQQSQFISPNTDTIPFVNQTQPVRNTVYRFEDNVSHFSEPYRSNFPHVNSQTQFHPNVKAKLDPHATTFRPREFIEPEVDPVYQSESVSSHLTQFLLKKDLLLSRFHKFDDRPETFATWKASFQSIVRELHVTAFEEMDLLVKWLGPDSSKFALSIRASNINDPVSGRMRIWERLEDRYGRPEMVESALKNKLYNFPKISNKDHKKLYDLLDILTEIQSTKENYHYSKLLAYYDSSSGIIPIVNKLPYSIQEKWTSQASKYKIRERVAFPPFSFFVAFIREVSAVKNDPAFFHESYNAVHSKKERFPNKASGGMPQVINRKTEIISHENSDEIGRCPIHKANHPLNMCRSFKMKSFEDRKRFLKEKNICFKCCASTKHMSRNCTAKVKCEQCDSNFHCTAMHCSKKQTFAPDTCDGGEPPNKEIETISTKCTKLCGEGFRGRSCGKVILLDIYPTGKPKQALRVYGILDDQSNRTLASTELLNKLSIEGGETQYTLSSCTGKVTMSGRRAVGLTVRAVSASSTLALPVVLECNEIPNDRSEIPTPEIASHFSHLKEIIDKVPALDPTSTIQLLIGRDLPEAHHVQKQLVGPRGTPFDQKLKLGWVIVGDVCLGKIHKPRNVNVNKINVMNDGRGTIFEPCKNNFHLKEHNSSDNVKCINQCDSAVDPLFKRATDDDRVGLSVEDRKFIALMDSEFRKNEEGCWSAPLPFRNQKRPMPDNKAHAWHRAKVLDSNLKKNPSKKAHFVSFMQKVLDSGAAEVASDSGPECWYLPLFGVYHPKKPEQIRGVFDSSAVYEGVSLNSVLMSGPDLVNSLVGVLLRFRKERIAITADIEQMFYRFFVNREHRDYLRFFWYKDNNPENPLIEYRMCVHVFGNSPSPAVATYGLRKAAENSEETFGSDVKEFVNRNFYVDDGLVSLPSEQEAIDLLKRTQGALIAEGNVRLHKITSNSSEVMSAFPAEDLGKNLKNLSIGQDSLPIEHSLGLSWDLSSDCFTFNNLKPDIYKKPYTRRGLLSTLNSIFDPLGFLAPATISGKILLRELTPPGTNWDEPLDPSNRSKWEEWTRSLDSLQSLHVPRMCVPVSLSLAKSVELHIFSDASEKAVAAVAYLKAIDSNGKAQIGFVMGKSKLAPTRGHTIPRLELCASVLATEVGEFILEHLDLTLDKVKYYTDSKVVLGYISNQTRRFYNYVSNRVERILKVSTPAQWEFIPSNFNSADSSTRCCTAELDVKVNSWLFGAGWLQGSENRRDGETCLDNSFPLVDPETDTEIRPQVNSYKTKVEPKICLGTKHFEKFSSWGCLVGAISLLRHVAVSFTGDADSCRGWHLCSKHREPECFKAAELFVLKEVQKENFQKEVTCLTEGRKLPQDSCLITLSPLMDSDGLLRVGGRLNKIKVQTDMGEINPIILPKNHHVSTLLIRKCHESVAHQGRLFTEGALRKNGYWVLGAKRAVSSVIKHCVTCRKLRGKFEQQKMAELPLDRITPGPPFTSVGVDTFGPWSVVTRRTRGGSAQSKRWAILFTCLTTRAVHIEVIEEMSSSCFINALRRFVAIRGQVKIFRSDRGTNFVGAVDSLKIDTVNVEDGPVQTLMNKSGCKWIFNAPHASHMGGVWERMIGIARKILNSVLLNSSVKTLTHECLATFMAEVCAIMNSRPIGKISTDPESPMVLSPSMLLTGKIDCLPVCSDSLKMKDMYAAQWKHVQVLSNIFWKLWKQDYLHCLQERRKWCSDFRNVKNGDIVLLKDKDLARYEWPMGIIVDAIASQDGRVRKACVRVHKDGKCVTYTRPITEMVLLEA